MQEEIIKLTVDEAANIFNCSKNTIYYWTRTKKVEYEDGDDTQILLMPVSQYEKYLKKYSINSNLNSNITQSHSSEFNPVSNSTQTKSQDNKEILKEVNFILEKVQYFADQAIEAERSKVRLLEDSEKRKEANYFEIKASLKQVQELNEKFQIEINKLQDELNKTQNELERVQKENDELKLKQTEIEHKETVIEPEKKKAGFMGLFKR